MKALAIAAAAALGVSPHALAQVAYELDPSNTFTIRDCPPPCTCAPSQTVGPLQGGFTLNYDHEDASFRYYSVDSVLWVATLGGVPTPIAGSGVYKIRIPVGWEHQLTLDLKVGQDVVRSFDSGLVTAGIHHVFPHIQALAQTVVFDCRQYEFDIVAMPAPCYANCDGSTVPPVLNVNDFICFQTRFAAGDPYANCDNSTVQPVLNVNDFICFQTSFAAGCN